MYLFSGENEIFYAAPQKRQMQITAVAYFKMYGFTSIVP